MVVGNTPKHRMEVLYFGSHINLDIKDQFSQCFLAKILQNYLDLSQIKSVACKIDCILLILKDVA